MTSWPACSGRRLLSECPEPLLHIVFAVTAAVRAFECRVCITVASAVTSQRPRCCHPLYWLSGMGRSDVPVHRYCCDRSEGDRTVVSSCRFRSYVIDLYVIAVVSGSGSGRRTTPGHPGQATLTVEDASHIYFKPHSCTSTSTSASTFVFRLALQRCRSARHLLLPLSISSGPFHN